MSSLSLEAFKEAKARALRLLLLSTDRRLRPISYAESEPAFHAALASLVSAWEAYVESIIIEAFDSILPMEDAAATSIILLFKSEAEGAVKKFNTPNAEKSREIILRYTGFDAFPYMCSPRLNMPANLARTRLNELLKVRHAFAHGFAIPNYSWTTRYGVANRLTKRSVNDSVRLISDFTKLIDAGLSKHLSSIFLQRRFW